MKRARGIGIVVISAALLLVGPTRADAQDKDAINAAIDRAVAALKRLQGPDGIWPFMGGGMGEKDIGCTALVGLALLEANVRANDPAILSAVQVVVRSAPRLTETYAIAAAIMFLDKHGEKGGVNQAGVIRALAQKLLHEQFPDGGWSYGGNANGASTDNSNTQFAILGLWVARKHNVDVEKALLRTEKRFRRTQDQGGGWGYGLANAPFGNTPTPSMTCAGLLGVFLGFGVEQQKIANLRAVNPGGGAPAAPAPPINLAGIQNDPAVQKAMSFLGQTVGGNIQGTQNWLYFLWSLERVCITYDFKAVNGVDWYEWGATILLKNQLNNGTWKADHGPAVDTAFALLFLKKANLVGNLRAIAPPAPPQAKPRPSTDEADRLAQNLVNAAAAKQAQLIEEYKIARGADYTFALGRAIPGLREAARDKARLALIERLESRTINTLRGYLEDEESELRRAAASAAGRKGKDEAVPDLIKLLKDRENAVADAAHEALKKLSGKDFEKDAAKWEAWWKAKDR